MKFSVITVVKNDKHKILKTINSVKNQKFRDFEYIIIDGKSRDGTSEIIDENIKKFKKCRHIIKKDKNLYEALNYGLKISKGNYIVILILEIYFLTKIPSNYLVFILKIMMQYPAMYYLKNKKILRFWNYKINELNKYSAFKVAHTSLIIKKELINKLKCYNTRYNISSDTDFILKLSLIKNLKFKYIDKIFVIMDSNGLSNSYKNIFHKISQDLNIYKKHFKVNFLFFYLFKIIYKMIKLFYWKLFKS